MEFRPDKNKQQKLDSWSDYFEKTKNKPPRPLLIKALPYIQEKVEALDIGSGALNDSVYLLSEGFQHVTAVDKEPIAQTIAEILPKEKFDYIISSIEHLDLQPEHYDLVNAQLSLPFVPSIAFKQVLEKIILSLKSGGIFTGQFFGDRDGWNYNEDMTFLTVEEARGMLSELNLISFEEIVGPNVTAAGNTKQWHIFDFIAKKEVQTSYHIPRN